MVMATQFIDPLFHSFYYMQYVSQLESEVVVVDADP